jgi:hypothetical protein
MKLFFYNTVVPSGRQPRLESDGHTFEEIIFERTGAWRIHKIKRQLASGTTPDSASASDTKQSLSVT